MAIYTNCQLEFTGNQTLKFVRLKCLKKRLYKVNNLLGLPAFLEGVPAEKAVGFSVTNFYR